MVSDVTRASVYNAVFLEIRDEDREVGDEDMCGELMVSMCGTRPAVSNWQKCYSDLSIKHGLKRSMASSCIFRHDENDLDVMHGTRRRLHHIQGPGGP